MSRALDSSVKNALQDGNHSEAFERISAVLERSYETYLEIEILPKSHVLAQDTYVLQDETYVGVPKLRLVQAFLHARQIMNSITLQKRMIGDDVIRRASAVTLLMDSEHLTAANIRKKLLVRGGTSDPRRTEDLKREVSFMNSLLTSRLHRHTKSPVLWNHKRWLLRQMRDTRMPIDPVQELEQVICVAAERHPRNYYAWTYARDVVATERASSLEQARLVVDNILPTMTRWCRLHHQDISGWSFLLHLMEMCPEKAEDVVDATLSLVETFKWRNESVWHFLKNSALLPALQAKRHCIVKVWSQMRADVGNDTSWDAAILDAAATWGKFE